MNELMKLAQAVTPDDFNKVALGLVALIALFVSPLVQWSIAKRQASLQEAIAKRQAELQEQIARSQVEIQSAIANRQAADNISSKRQVWIDELRKDAAEYLSVVARLEELRRPDMPLSAEDQRVNFEEMASLNYRGSELGIRIKLRLNPNEDEHNELLRLLGALADACGDPPPDETAQQRAILQSRFHDARSEVISQVQTILKHEWERVKRGDI